MIKAQRAWLQRVGLQTWYLAGIPALVQRPTFVRITQWSEPIVLTHAQMVAGGVPPSQLLGKP